MDDEYAFAELAVPQIQQLRFYLAQRHVLKTAVQHRNLLSAAQTAPSLLLLQPGQINRTVSCQSLAFVLQGLFGFVAIA